MNIESRIQHVDRLRQTIAVMALGFHGLLRYVRPESTFAHQLFHAEIRARKRGVDYLSQPYYEQRNLVEPLSKLPHDHFVISNEMNTTIFLPFVDKQQGSMIAVGVEQGLDLLAKSNKIDALYIIDHDPLVSILSRVYLEVALRHDKSFGVPPTPEEFIRYFTTQHIRSYVYRFIKEAGFTKDNLKLAETALSYFNRAHTGVSEKMQLRCELQRDSDYKPIPWYGTTESIRKVVEAYKRGNIVIVCGDIGSEQFMSNIAKHASDKGRKFSSIYISNSPYYMTPEQNVALARFLQFPQVIDESSILLTTMPMQGILGDISTSLEMFNPWHYVVMSAKDYARRCIEHPGYYMTHMCADITKRSKQGVWITNLS